jgi:hypothetical protein
VGGLEVVVDRELHRLKRTSESDTSLSVPDVESDAESDTAAFDSHANVDAGAGPTDAQQSSCVV